MISAGVFECSVAIQTRMVPLELDNSLTTIPFLFRTSDADEVTFFTHADSCAAINIGNIALQQWIITTKPDIVHNYIQFDEKYLFYPIIFNCALGQDSNAPFPDYLAGNITVIVIKKHAMWMRMISRLIYHLV